VIWLLLALLQAPTELTVVRADFCAERKTCESWRPYTRVDDLGGPIWFLVSTTGQACEVSGMVANRVHRQERWACAWRYARS